MKVIQIVNNLLVSYASLTIVTLSNMIPNTTQFLIIYISLLNHHNPQQPQVMEWVDHKTSS
jgi:hypothetical protein